jgi:hypothetical protein
MSTRRTRGDSVLFDAAPPLVRAEKILNATHFSVVAVRGENQLMFAAAGRYTLDGDGYTETYEVSSWKPVGSERYTSSSRVAGDRWSTDGEIGSDGLHEVWRRVH